MGKIKVLITCYGQKNPTRILGLCLPHGPTSRFLNCLLGVIPTSKRLSQCKDLNFEHLILVKTFCRLHRSFCWTRKIKILLSNDKESKLWKSNSLQKEKVRNPRNNFRNKKLKKQDYFQLGQSSPLDSFKIPTSFYKTQPVGEKK